MVCVDWKRVSPGWHQGEQSNGEDSALVWQILVRGKTSALFWRGVPIWAFYKPTHAKRFLSDIRLPAVGPINAPALTQMAMNADGSVAWPRKKSTEFPRPKSKAASLTGGE